MVCCSEACAGPHTVQRLTGNPDSAVRCAKWNSCDLSKGAGVKLLLQRLDLEEPNLVWISPPCGPFSPLQNSNARTETQRAELQIKRHEAMRIYVGVCVIIHRCIQKGIHVVLELSERCQAWRLPLFQKLQAKYKLLSAVTKGCRVGLRCSESRPLMQKGWRILTTHHRMAQVLELPCRCPKGYQHDRCEGKKASQSELYTKEYMHDAPPRLSCKSLITQRFCRSARDKVDCCRPLGKGSVVFVLRLACPKDPKDMVYVFWPTRILRTRVWRSVRFLRFQFAWSKKPRGSCRAKPWTVVGLEAS